MESDTEPRGWFARLKAALSRSSSKIGDGISAIFGGGKIDDDTLESLEELLIQADMGLDTAAHLTGTISKTRFGSNASGDELKGALAEEIETILEPVAQPLAYDLDNHKPFVVLVVGVNGSGKTTTIGKMARNATADGHKVMLAAGDTFRAAAVEQLTIWAERTGSKIVKRDTGSDAAGLAFEAMEKAQADAADILMIDTAGRLQNKTDLMQELAKLVRVIRKRDETAPHATLLVLDATVGQNAHSQVETFKEMVSVTGLVMTKLDGSARGGVVVALARKFGLPVHAVGVGEGADDLRPFSARDFARSLVGL
ncbi:MAG: signal recognition particle-docking protein FtsY [Pseudomonadota bacterium]